MHSGSDHSKKNLISPEAEEFIATEPYDRAGLRKLATLLPVDDWDLHEALVAAGEALNGKRFQLLSGAAAMGGRKLQASLLTAMMLVMESPWNMAWMAWRMEGNVAEELLRGLETVVAVKNETRALALFVAAAWWQKHRAGEELPRPIQHRMLELSKEKGLDARTILILQDLAILLGEAEFARARAAAKMPASPSLQRKQLDKAFALLDGPFERFVYDRLPQGYSGTLPQRRAAEHIGRNEKCPCGSGKKYKHCCSTKDQERLRHSSSVPGM
ncbi:MAG: SEC-C domain-containing protein, partial [Acidobacteriota bacterium]|nr:SEC-C domain-containing protein [Acidobacteriota bacterium]